MALKQSVWTELIDEAGILSVLTDEYAQFARPISEALCVFLEGLPADRQTQIVNEQAAMPAASSVAERLGRMAQGCPALHKFGQIVARDRRIAPELRTHLQRLESLPSSIPLGVIRDALGREVGPLDALGVSLKPPALAEASVAVVVPFRRCDDHPADAPCDGVFKILKPGIEVRLEQDLSLLGSVGEYLDERCNELQIPALDYADAFAQVRDKLLQEVRLDHEQKHLRAAYAEYADDHNVQIPRLFEFGSPRVTAMERICGGKVTDAVADSPFDRRRIAETVVASLLARPMFSLLADAPFHCDPHAGNLFVTPDRRLAILDWSLVGSLTVEHRTAVVQIMLAAATLRSDRVISIISNLADRGAADRSALRRIVHASIQEIRRGQFSGLAWLVGMLDEAVAVANLKLPGDLMLFRKTLHTLEGVVQDLDPDGASIDDVLRVEFFRQLAQEWPFRWMAPPASRDFATRLSNADLAETMCNLPYTVARYWLGVGA